MKIAIHEQAGSFSERWIKYCKDNNVPYKLLNCYDTDIISQLNDCDGLMWHWTLNDYKAALFARQLIISIEEKGIKVFPDVNTGWHYDDKLGQKYLLEAVGAPIVNSYLFYSKQDALNWLDMTNFPKVFKLRGGAGSENVRLVNSKTKAKKLIRKAFGGGFSHINHISRLNDRIRIFKRDKNLISLRGVISGIARLFIPTEVERFSHNEKGYIYFQDFIPDNEYDTRLVVIGDRCFGMRRYCRTNDFRASGSGIIEYEPELIDSRCIQTAFEVAKKLNTQSVAFDFILDDNEPKIVEISYCFVMRGATENCPGFWDSDLKWHERIINPQYFMIEDFIDLINRPKASI